MIRELRDQGVLPAGARRYGPRVLAPSGAGHLTRGMRRAGDHAQRVVHRGIVRVLPQAGPVVVDGGAGWIAALAAFGALDPRRALSYARRTSGRRASAPPARPGATVVISDGNRRRAFVASRPRGRSVRRCRLGRASASMGRSWIRGSASPGVGDRAAALRDRERHGARIAAGDAVPRAPAVRRARRRPVHRVAGRPHAGASAPSADRDLRRATRRRGDRPDALSDSRGRVEEVAVAGRRFRVHRGWNRLTLGSTAHERSPSC